LGSAFSREAALYGNASRESVQNGRPDKDMKGGLGLTSIIVSGFYMKRKAAPDEALASSVLDCKACCSAEREFIASLGIILDAQL
jgi:hypothetical protein